MAISASQQCVGHYHYYEVVYDSSLCKSFSVSAKSIAFLWHLRSGEGLPNQQQSANIIIDHLTVIIKSLSQSRSPTSPSIHSHPHQLECSQPCQLLLFCNPKTIFSSSQHLKHLMTPLPVIVLTTRYGAGCPRLTMIKYTSLSFNSRAIALANQPFLRSSRQQTNNAFFRFVDIFQWPLCSTSRLPQLCKEGIQTKLLAWKDIIRADIKRPAALLPLSHHSCQLNDEIPP